jgi:thiamine-phosphate pyrophosphorylase
MPDPDRPQIYLVTPAEFDLSRFPDRLAAVLDAVEVACVRLAPASRDADRVARAADAIRAVAHARDVAVLVERHLAIAARHGLDGVHLPEGARGLRKARAALGRDAIIGAFCGASRHEGITAGEAGADYVAFGPVGACGLGDGTLAPRELFAWWSEMIELPVVAEGGITLAILRDLAPVADFLAFGEEIWREPDAAAALRALTAAMP